MNQRSWIDRIEALPPERQSEVRDFVRSLEARSSKKPQARLRLDWRGALENLREHYTSSGLMHKALEWEAE